MATRVSQFQTEGSRLYAKRSHPQRRMASFARMFVGAEFLGRFLASYSMNPLPLQGFTQRVSRWTLQPCLSFDTPDVQRRQMTECVRTVDQTGHFAIRVLE